LDHCQISGEFNADSLDEIGAELNSVLVIAKSTASEFKQSPVVDDMSLDNAQKGQVRLCI
jgi:hypothetical protein